MIGSLISSTSTAVLAAALTMVAGTALAAQPGPASNGPAPGIPGANDSAPATVSEIVVTAQKRAELEVNVPISVSAFSGDQLEKANVVSDMQLQKLTPGLRMDQYGVFVIPTIRGVGTNTLGQGLLPVSIYVDGVYQMDEFGNLLDLPNVSQVQVLKGPQGTLFGRNTEAGAILVSTLDPTDRPQVEAMAAVGNYNERRAHLYLSGPLAGDVLTGNIDAYVRRNDGYLHNHFTGSATDGRIDNLNLTGKLLWKPTDKVSFLLKLSYGNDIDQSANNYVAAVDPATGKGFATANYLVPKPGQPAVCIATDPFSTCNYQPPEEQIITTQDLLKGTFDFGWAVLTSYTSYIRDHDTDWVEQDSTNYNLATYHWHVHEQTIQQEFDLNGRIPNTLDWVVGAYFAHDRTLNTGLLIGCAPVTTTCLSTGSSVAKDTNYAVFGDATLQVIHNLYLDLGLRYSVEPKSTVNLSIPKYAPSNAIFITTFPGFEFKNSFYSTTPKLSIRYQFAPKTNIYYTWSVGYKSGTFNTSGFGSPSVKPETLYANELGFKTRTNRLSFDAAAYYYNYDNLQFQNSTLINGVVKPVLSSAGDARIYGAEAELQYVFSHEFSVNAGVNWNHSRYVNFNHAIILYPCSAANIAAFAGQGVKICNGLVDNGEYQNANVNVSGRQMIRAPDLTLSITPNYRKETSVGVFEASANLYHSSRVYFQADDNPLFSAAPYTILDLNASWAPNEHFRISAWGTNVTDEKYLNTASPDTVSARVRYAAPAMWGVTLTYTY